MTRIRQLCDGLHFGGRNKSLRGGRAKGKRGGTCWRPNRRNLHAQSATCIPVTVARLRRRYSSACSAASGTTSSVVRDRAVVRDARSAAQIGSSSNVGAWRRRRGRLCRAMGRDSSRGVHGVGDHSSSCGTSHSGWRSLGRSALAPPQKHNSAKRTAYAEHSPNESPGERRNTGRRATCRRRHGRLGRESRGRCADSAKGRRC